jgi:type VI protein secretion system component Hcp
MKTIERGHGNRGWSMNAGLVGLLLGAGFVSACAGTSSGPSGDDELVGTAVLALSAAPADASCIQVTAAGYRTVKETFDVAPGASTIETMSGLPLGQVTFTAQAFGAACPPGGATPTGPANWVSDAPFTTTVAVSPPSLVTLNLVRDGSVSVSIGFDDMAAADGGATGSSTGTGGAGPGPDAGAGGAAGAPAPVTAPIAAITTGAAFMRVGNIKGEAVSKGFEGWFDVTGFGFLATVPGGGGLQWTTTATLRYQRGVPELYAAAAAGQVVGPVDLWFRSGSGIVYLKETLTNALVSSIVDTGAAGSTPTLALTLTSTRLDLSFTPQTAAGGAGAPITVFWDATTNSGSTAAPANLDFTVGAPRPTAQDVASFHAPAATGPGVFADASVVTTVNAAILQDLISEANHTVVPTGSVQFFRATATGNIALYGSYGFTNAVVHSVGLAGANTVTVGFGATGFTWAVGPEMTMFP